MSQEDSRLRTEVPDFGHGRALRLGEGLDVGTRRFQVFNVGGVHLCVGRVDFFLAHPESIPYESVEFLAVLPQSLVALATDMIDDIGNRIPQLTIVLRGTLFCFFDDLHI